MTGACSTGSSRPGTTSSASPRAAATPPPATASGSPTQGTARPAWLSITPRRRPGTSRSASAGRWYCRGTTGWRCGPGRRCRPAIMTRWPAHAAPRLRGRALRPTGLRRRSTWAMPARARLRCGSLRRRPVAGPSPPDCPRLSQPCRPTCGGRPDRPTNPMKTDAATAMIAIATAPMPASPVRTGESFRFSSAIGRSIDTSASAPRIVCRSTSATPKIGSPPSAVAGLHRFAKRLGRVVDLLQARASGQKRREHAETGSRRAGSHLRRHPRRARIGKSSVAALELLAESPGGNIHRIVRFSDTRCGRVVSQDRHCWETRNDR